MGVFGLYGGILFVIFLRCLWYLVIFGVGIFFFILGIWLYLISVCNGRLVLLLRDLIIYLDVSFLVVEMCFEYDDNIYFIFWVFFLK